METLLEPPIETIAVRYSAAAAGPICASIALLTAAIGIWRLRLVGSKRSKPAVAVAESSGAAARWKSPPPALIVVAPPPDAARMIPEEELFFTPKARFTAYYAGDDDAGGDNDDDDGDDRSDAGASTAPSWPQIGVRRRGAGPDWYRRLDMAALNGSVVRLWDGVEPAAAEEGGGFRVPVRGIFGSSGEYIGSSPRGEVRVAKTSRLRCGAVLRS